jgi:hypothetical protein
VLIKHTIEILSRTRNGIKTSQHIPTNYRQAAAGASFLLSHLTQAICRTHQSAALKTF